MVYSNFLKCYNQKTRAQTVLFIRDRFITEFMSQMVHAIV